ncbi:MAG TPA: hypothetical protein PKC87_02800 [Candidatus Absconditabacterales bacterium]|nr:hypothetical protein [Candidatus Absconditabacterales bacterium]
MCETFTPGEGYSNYSDEQILEMRKQLYLNMGLSNKPQNIMKQENIGETNSPIEEEEGEYILGLA